MATTDVPWSDPADVDDLQGFNGLIFGHAGSGKTTLGISATQAQSGSPLLIVNFDVEVRSIKDLRGGAVKVWPGVKDEGRIRNWQHIVGFTSRLASGRHPFKSIMFDTLNGAYDFALKHVRATTNHRDGRAIFGEANDLILSLAREWCAISREQGLNVIFTCHDAEKQDGENGPVFIRPDITPGVIRGLYQAVSVIGYLEERPQGKRRLTLRNKLNVIAKVHQPQSGEQLPLEIDNPNLGKIIDHLRGVAPYPRMKPATAGRTAANGR